MLSQIYWPKVIDRLTLLVTEVKAEWNETPKERELGLQRTEIKPGQGVKDESRGTTISAASYLTQTKYSGSPAANKPHRSCA